MEIFSKPGSLTVYSTAKRSGLPPPSDCPKDVGPASYDNNKSCITSRTDTVAPFDTTAIRNELIPNGYPGPSDYNPNQRPRREYGVPRIGVGPRFRDENYCSDSPGPIYKVPDPWDQMTEDAHVLNTTKRPRIQCDKYVSNNVPTVFNTRDMKSFVKGMDGRMYPWWKKRSSRIPGPKYDVSYIYTSKSKGPYHIDFEHCAKRPPIFRIEPGFGPADFNTRLDRVRNGGLFLSKTDDPCTSAPRMFDMIVCQNAKNPNCSPSTYYPKGSFDKPCPKAVTAPFKSKVPKLGFTKEEIGPGPATYFEDKPKMQDIEPPLIGYCFSEEPEGAPFDTSAERFGPCCQDYWGPSPDRYNIYGFTDMMQYNLCRHEPAVINPKLGFLTSAEARPKAIFAANFTITLRTQPPEVPGQWVNVRPKKIKTYDYFGPPSKSTGPGPNAYDTRSGYAFLKGKKSFWNPRDYTGTGFDNSGCGRKIVLQQIDKDIPGPHYDARGQFPGPGGNIKTTGTRFNKFCSDGPGGGKHKPHEKTESMWRATQLGTYNVFLKGIDRLCPTAGGFHPHGPLDDLGDEQRGFLRIDDYASDITPATPFDNSIKSSRSKSSRTNSSNSKKSTKFLKPMTEDESISVAISSTAINTTTTEPEYDYGSSTIPSPRVINNSELLSAAK